MGRTDVECPFELLFFGVADNPSVTRALLNGRWLPSATRDSEWPCVDSRDPVREIERLLEEVEPYPERLLLRDCRARFTVHRL